MIELMIESGMMRRKLMERERGREDGDSWQEGFGFWNDVKEYSGRGI